MNLQERVTTLMIAENDRVKSRVTSRFFPLWDGDTMELSTVNERSWSEQALHGKKSSSILSRLSLRWWVDIHAEISAWDAEMFVNTWVSEVGKEKSS